MDRSPGNTVFYKDPKSNNISDDKKKYYQAAAVQAVIKLTETEITIDLLTECCKYLNQTFYNDVVTERSISSICGYPLCAKSLNLARVPRQKYRISTRLNKVYDITDRKNFCSGLCFKSSKYLEVQLKSCPVWLHETEGPITIKFLPHDEKIKCGIIGDEIIINDNKSVNLVMGKEKEDDNSVHMTGISQGHSLLPNDVEPSRQITILEKNLPEKVELENNETNSGIDGKFKLPQKTETSIIPNNMLQKVQNALQEWMTSESLQHIGQNILNSSREECQTNESTTDEAGSTNPEAHIAIRRSIVFDKLNKVCARLAIELGIPSTVILDNIKPFLHTFRFSAHNISFRLNEWRLLCLILLHLAALRSVELKEILESHRTSQNDILQNIQLCFEDIKPVIETLKNIKLV